MATTTAEHDHLEAAEQTSSKTTELASKTLLMISCCIDLGGVALQRVCCCDFGDVFLENVRFGPVRPDLDMQRTHNRAVIMDSGAAVQQKRALDLNMPLSGVRMCKTIQRSSKPANYSPQSKEAAFR